MLHAAYMPHSGSGEVDYIETLESVMETLTEKKRAGAVDCFIGGDLNIEFRPDNADGDLQGLDSIGWYGPECRGGR